MPEKHIYVLLNHETHCHRNTISPLNNKLLTVVGIPVAVQMLSRYKRALNLLVGILTNSFCKFFIHDEWKQGLLQFSKEKFQSSRDHMNVPVLTEQIKLLVCKKAEKFTQIASTSSPEISATMHYVVYHITF